MQQISEVSRALQAFPVELTLWGIFAITLIVYSIFSAVLVWHWNQYSTGKFTTLSNMFLYVGVSGVFLGCMFSGVVWFALS